MGSFIEDNKHMNDIEITQAIYGLENFNAYLASINYLMERIFDIKICGNVESEYKNFFQKVRS